MIHTIVYAAERALTVGTYMMNENSAQGLGAQNAGRYLI